jgi:hypothetical protein
MSRLLYALICVLLLAWHAFGQAPAQRPTPPPQRPQSVPGAPGVVVVTPQNEGDGLDEANAKRRARGLRPYKRDAGLTKAAEALAKFRAKHLLFGHTSNDFGFVPEGVKCEATGCAAYPAHYGWLTCATYDDYTRAGAYWAQGADGQRYMHLCIGYGEPQEDRGPVAQAPPPQKPDPGVVTWREVTCPDTTGRMAKWLWPSDMSKAKPIFQGYIDTSTVQPGWEMNPVNKQFYATQPCTGFK